MQIQEGKIVTSIDFELTISKSSSTSSFEPELLAQFVKKTLESRLAELREVARVNGNPAAEDELEVEITVGNTFITDLRQ